VRAGQRGRQRVAGHDLLEQRAGPRTIHLGSRAHVLHPALAETQKSAAFEDGRGQRIAVSHQFSHRDRRTSLDTFDKPEVGRGEKPDVVGVLAVDALEALGNDQLHAGELFRSRAVFARRALAIAPAGHHHFDAVQAYGIRGNRHGTARPQACVRIAAELVVIVREDGQRRDFVSRNIVAQRHGLVQPQPLALQAAADGIKRLAQKEHVWREADCIRNGWR
jgi:hypothetical protein